MQEVKCGSSLGAGNDTALHFGLGDDVIREMRVRWPNGKEMTLTDVDVNQFLQVNYADVDADSAGRPGGKRLMPNIRDVAKRGRRSADHRVARNQ